MLSARLLYTTTSSIWPFSIFTLIFSSCIAAALLVNGPAARAGRHRRGTGGLRLALGGDERMMQQQAREMRSLRRRNRDRDPPMTEMLQLHDGVLAREEDRPRGIERRVEFLRRIRREGLRSLGAFLGRHRDERVEVGGRRAGNAVLRHPAFFHSLPPR